ncbi:MAG TPA: LCP family protein [Dermatophilaceae bacterium]|nr:LCP family protein [Dermatophilaceae bacterium]
MGRFYGLTFLGTLVPGAGLTAAGRRLAGGLLLVLTAATLAGLGYLAWRRGLVRAALDLAVRPDQLRLASIAIAVAALVWVLSIIWTAVATRPERISRGQGLLATVFALLMCLLVAAPAAELVRYLNIQHDVVQTVFAGPVVVPSNPSASVATPEITREDPWANTPRVNVLLLGSDSGADRIGVRTDSMIVASIDTHTGNTVLFGVPRNLEKVPFPAHDPLHRIWPNGFNCGAACLMNAVWTEASSRANLFPGDRNPGLTATRDAISEVLGLRIDNTVVIDLRGFQSLVDAMGGVTINVRERIPIGGEVTADHRIVGILGWIEKGRQHMNGYKALWYSRSRATTDDFSRMRRQRCMVGALVDQVNPVAMLGRYPSLASVAKKNVQVDIAQNQLPAWVELVQRMQRGAIRSLPFTSTNVNVADPDFAAIRAMVRRALRASVAPAPTTTTPSPGRTTKPGTRPTPAPPNPAVEGDQLVEIKEAC